jgi:RNA polymerase sigma-70 factor, ECF subfamily
LLVEECGDDACPSLAAPTLRQAQRDRTLAGFVARAESAGAGGTIPDRGDAGPSSSNRGAPSSGAGAPAGGPRGPSSNADETPAAADPKIGHHGRRVEPDEIDAGLVPRLVARDERAFTILVRAYEGRVFALLLRMTGNRAEAEDLAQEVFVQVFKAIGSFRGESKLSTWIYRIAVNLSKNRGKYLRVRRSGHEVELGGLLEGAEAAVAVGGGTAAVPAIDRPDEMASGKQVERIVQRAILELEPSFRECLVLRDVEDLSYDDIASITGLPEGTVKSRIHRARAQLKEIVEAALGEKIA